MSAKKPHGNRTHTDYGLEQDRTTDYRIRTYADYRFDRIMQNVDHDSERTTEVSLSIHDIHECVPPKEKKNRNVTFFIIKLTTLQQQLERTGTGEMTAVHLVDRTETEGHTAPYYGGCYTKLLL